MVAIRELSFAAPSLLCAITMRLTVSVTILLAYFVPETEESPCVYSTKRR